MSASSISSTSLHVLEHRNQSKSTVSSSDTDLDSAGYVSSSGTTTPEDDTQTFLFGPTFRLADGPQRGPREKLAITTKQRSFISAVKRVKKAVHALAAFRRKRPDDISPILISTPLRERFGKRMSIKPQPDENFYSLPNRRFSLSDASAPPQHSETIARKFGTISGSAPSFVKLKKRRSGLRIPSFSDQQQNTLPPSAPVTVTLGRQHAAMMFRTNTIHMLRILLFVPWCAAVGGALLLFPSYVELVAFRTGYLESPQGIRRYAHWAECGQQHVMIFLACLFGVVWHNLPLGLSLVSIVASRLVFVWYAFKVDKGIPLGEDDQQSLYLTIVGLAFTDGSFSVSGMKRRQTVVKLDDSVEEVNVTKA